jgi:XRE family transcriptional regulator, regulator of sulfur utilization
MNNTPSEDLAANLLELRRLRQLSLRDLASAAGTSLGALSKIESGSGNPKLETLAALASVLQVSLSDLLQPGRRVVDITRRGEMELPLGAGPVRRIAGQITLGGSNLEISWVVFGGRSRHLAGAAALHHLLIYAGTVEVDLGNETLSASRGDYLRIASDAGVLYRAKDSLAMGLMLEERRG